MESNNKIKNIIIITICLLILIIVGLVLFVMFDKGMETKGEKDTNNKNVYLKYRMSGNNLEDFDLKFLKSEANEKNMVYSPLSIKYALAMLSDGTKGDSKIQIDSLIGDYKTKKYTNSSNMSFVNSMFIRDTFSDEINESYITNLKDKYNAEIIYDKLENPDTINYWVKDKTFGMIDKLYDDVSEGQFYLANALAINMKWNKLIQAINETYEDNYNIKYAHENYSTSIKLITSDDDYNTVKFNNSMNSKAVEIGASINKYDIVKTLGEDNIRKTITEEYEKWLKTGECSGENPDWREKDVNKFVNKFIEELDSNYKKIESSTDFRFYDDENVKSFSKELKEYDGITLEYVGIMPKKETLSEYINKVTAKSLNEIISKQKTIELDNFEEGKVTKITGGIPLFKYDYELNLEDDLKALGVTDIFNAKKVNLSGMTKDKKITIGDVKHKTNIEFSNEGIKAAAVTAGGGFGDGFCAFEHLYEVPIVEIDLTFDNPYLYIIRDKKTGEVWFMGTVYNPIENNNNYAKIINEKK